MVVTVVACKPRDRASTWYLVFTRFNADLFTRDMLVDWIMKFLSQTSSPRVTPESLRRDVEVFLRTYVPSNVTRDLLLFGIKGSHYSIGLITYTIM